jgi:hypothetical protein
MEETIVKYSCIITNNTLKDQQASLNCKIYKENHQFKDPDKSLNQFLD